ncbi:MAG: HAMP domain-containing histidine kinase [Brucellaceae bacterium]|nr:HAMP domain-containing histidine kinase [Brucellaceae bacterium]
MSTTRYAVINDKIIVDRRKPQRNSEVSQFLRKNREMLVQKSDNPDFDREMLQLHARTMISSLPAISLLVFMIAVGGLFLGKSVDLLLWAVITISGYAAFAFAARRINQMPVAEVQIVRTKRLFLALHCVIGLTWAYLAWSSCAECQPFDYRVFQATSLLFAIGMTAILTYAIRGALVTAFSAPVFAFLISSSLSSSGLAAPVQVMLAMMLIAGMPFFSFVAGRMYDAAWMFMSFSSEKDGLIAELETAKAHSDEARLRAEESNLAKSRFLASMSHELRTPLNAILGFSEVMANEVLGPLENATYKEYASDIHDSGNHLLKVINEILDLSRIEAGKREFEESSILIADVVDECARMVEMRTRGKGITLRQQAEKDMPPVWADQKAVRQIVLNLLSNAIKFTPTDGEILVRVGWTRNGGQYITVKDNGPGIPEEEIPVVLSAFGQGSIAIKSAEQGTGLGLPIVQALTALHGGTFRLRSKLREGTEAIVIFPANRTLTDASTAPAEADDPDAGQRESA